MNSLAIASLLALAATVTGADVCRTDYQSIRTSCDAVEAWQSTTMAANGCQAHTESWMPEPLFYDVSKGQALCKAGCVECTATFVVDAEECVQYPEEVVPALANGNSTFNVKSGACHADSVDSGFMRHDNTVYVGHNLFVESATKESCLKTCFANPQCAGVDYGLGLCYGKAEGMAQLGEKGVSDNFFHFEKKSNTVPFGYSGVGWNSTGFGALIDGTAVDVAGNVYAVNYGTNSEAHTIGMMTPDGQSSLFYAHDESQFSTTNTNFNSILVSATGDMFLGDYVNNKIYKLVGGDPARVELHHQFPESLLVGFPLNMALMENGEIFASGQNWGTNTGGGWWVSADGTTSKEVVPSPDRRTNGIALSPGDEFLYITENNGNHPKLPDGELNAHGGDFKDHVDQNIWKYKVGAMGELTDKTLFFNMTDRAATHIDTVGLRCDTEGNLFAARHGLHKVLKISPAGEVIREYSLTMGYPTSIEFGGPDGKTLYVAGRCGGKWGRGPGCMSAIQVEGAPGKNWAILHSSGR